MKLAKKLLLVSAIAALSSSAFAMQSMDDESLSGTTGQDGIDITIAPPAGGISFSAVYHDTNGILAPSTWVNSGALVIGRAPGGAANTPFSITNANGFLIKLDVGGKADTDAGMLQLAVSSTASTTINTGDISIAKSHASGNGIVTTSQSGKILDSMAITLGSGNLMNIQLGNEEQGSMIRLNTVLSTGLNITNFKLNDANSGGGIGVGTVAVSNCASANCATTAAALNVDVGVNVTATALVATVNATNGFGLSANGGAYVKLSSVTLGSAQSMGNVEIYGLNLAGTSISLAGHN